jgi:hypothetical protein
MQQANLDVFNSTDPKVLHSLVQNIFSTTKCYDLMQNSSKVCCVKSTLSCIFILPRLLLFYCKIMNFAWSNTNSSVIVFVVIRRPFLKQRFLFS